MHGKEVAKNEACLLCEAPRFRDEVEHWAVCSMARFWAMRILKIDKSNWIMDNKGPPSKKTTH